MDTPSLPPVRQMVIEAVRELGGECTYPAIKAKVKSIYGTDVNDSSLTCSIIAGSVNHPSRIHYGENKKPRIADTQYDFLFNTGRGRVVWYEPQKHGVVVGEGRDDQDVDGVLRRDVRQVSRQQLDLLDVVAMTHFQAIQQLHGCIPALVRR